MKLKLLLAAMLAGGLVAGASAKAPSLKHDIRAEMAQLRMEAAPTPVSTNGDPDSFGRNARYIGLMASGQISLANDCTPDPSFPPGPDDHCFVLNAQPAVTNFVVNDAARMVIPAKASNSLFCHWQTPLTITQFRNNTAANISARIVVTPSYVIQNAVLNDPSLIDPNTGLPFNGQFTVSLTGIRHVMPLEPNEVAQERDTGTRTCIAGLVSKQALIDGYGLSPALAAKFFQNDTAITMNVTGQAAGVDFSSIIYSTRFMGD